MPKDYKALKEDFVSNLTGSSIGDIAWVTSIVPVAIACYSLLQTKYRLFEHYGPVSSGVDFLLNVGAFLLATTIYSSNPILLHLLLIAPAILIRLSPGRSQKKHNKPPLAKTKKDDVVAESLDPLPLKPFLTTYRGQMMVITCLAILAVDFRIFPRKYAKVENWGTSLMDIGVGSFVFAAGLVAARGILKEKLTGRHSSLSARLSTSMRHSAPLLILGLIRLWSVKGLDYAEHVTEYGVHWNFFFTLGFLPPFVAIFQTAFQLIPSFELWAVLLAAAYQLALELTELKAFVLTAPRTNLFSQNREGIFSFVGYLSIFLAGQGTGMYVIPRNIVPGAPTGSWTQRKRLLQVLTVASFSWSVAYMVTAEYYGLGLTVSRRLANLPYVLFVVAFNCLQILAFCAIETIFFPEIYRSTDRDLEKRNANFATSKVLSAYNRNGLAIFLLANLLTGLINLTIPTLNVGDAPAMAVLLAYAGLLTAVAVVLDRYNISIKL